ncbi:aldehyde oxidase 2-like [Mizuhopecten yessoensis]|uniref:aldehyde oxidase 2-like n=1 Tax=Mizuhopecten yessoensis TaxID=6573 RepID=UPI000B45A85D|nr:aldehyde oxidase 2-like [Mizuhopecten yessoensis]
MSVVGIAAVGAWKTKRPVRCVLDRTTDIQITGKRHPSKTLYKVYFSDDGRILGLNVKFYINAGYSLDCSPFVNIQRTKKLAMYHSINSLSENNVSKTI